MVWLRCVTRTQTGAHTLPIESPIALNMCEIWVNIYV